MQLTLPFEIICLAKQLSDKNFETYLVGGAVRDLFIAQLHPTAESKSLVTDYDLATNATPTQITALLPKKAPIIARSLTSPIPIPSVFVIR